MLYKKSQLLRDSSICWLSIILTMFNQTVEIGALSVNLAFAKFYILRN